MDRVGSLQGDLNDHISLVGAIKQVDVVICLISSSQVSDQTKIIAAIKEAGNIKRFFPSEFGSDVDRTKAVGLAKSAFSLKAQIRRAIEADGIPYTYIVSNCFSGFFLPSLGQFQQGILSSPPRDKVLIYGDGNVKGIINAEEDIAAYTIRAVDDSRTLNKVLYINCPENIVSMNDLVTLWEKKIGKTLEKTYVSEEQLLKNIEDSPAPINMYLSLTHSVFVKGDQTSFTLNPAYEVEVSELYPDVKYTSVEEYLDKFV
ncbi:PREDICTED: isoflavone reductase homolog P3-like isoform X2 [Tarenaya hassleriana]|uniref:isoflavone reductase homolog P3-like isoform X2 n=1 Tax=Tarenaya hassleriana TaxID=28532 RepID=UPI00053C2003|nr:PREDICTED: isoflavone reductase homolog P3-like isoform X2 [Tarenaya hassleriana]